MPRRYWCLALIRAVRVHHKDLHPRWPCQVLFEQRLILPDLALSLRMIDTIDDLGAIRGEEWATVVPREVVGLRRAVLILAPAVWRGPAASCQRAER